MLAYHTARGRAGVDPPLSSFYPTSVLLCWCSICFGKKKKNHEEGPKIFLESAKIHASCLFTGWGKRKSAEMRNGPTDTEAERSHGPWPKRRSVRPTATGLLLAEEEKKNNTAIKTIPTPFENRKSSSRRKISSEEEVEGAEKWETAIPRRRP